MIPEIGHFALVLALSITIFQAVLPLLGSLNGKQEWMAMAVPTVRMQTFFMTIAYACLTYAFIVNDFSVLYVAMNSNTSQPLLYRISGVWGAHEGSLLLWAYLLSLWSLAISIFSRGLALEFTARVLSVIGFITIGFQLFILMTSNPFTRLLPAAMEGRELNPLLQDPGLAFHPPLLYMGYVGMVVPFAFAIAALLGGRLDAAWVRWSRPWTAIGWAFLTFGIALGSWWAYYELGWGGWWFWDPVENASFMPWLVATGLIHSLAVTEKRGAFKSWTVLLAIFAFSFSLLGTFLVRSGVLVSVHAFASDPARGIFILFFLGAVIGSSLLLYAWRATAMSGGGKFELLSRDTLLLVNNVLLVIASASILLGTLYPLILDALGGGKVSVGPPYFESTFVPLMLPLLLLVGVGPLVRWKSDKLDKLVKRLALPLALSILIGTGLLLLSTFKISIVVAVCISTAVWITWTTALAVWDRLKGGGRLTPAFTGMVLAHIGVAIFTVGATLISAYSIEKDVSMKPGDTLQLNQYTYRFDSVVKVNADIAAGRNFLANRATVTVLEGDEVLAVLNPEKRIYSSSRQDNPMTEAAIDSSLTRDFYVALGDSGANGAWSLRIYLKQFTLWLWVGPTLMGLGGILAAMDRRYRMGRKVAKATEPEAPVDNMAVEGKA